MMPADLPRARIASAVPGRLRLRFSAQRGDAAFFATLAPRALVLPGVLAARATPATGGLLLRFHGDLAALLEAAARERLFAATLPREAGLASRPAELGRIGGTALALLAVVQALRGAVLPPAVTLLWYAGSLRASGQSGEE
jgi:hypothetical protein